MKINLNIFMAVSILLLTLVFGQNIFAQEPATDLIKTDNGKPWIANPETTEGINNMINLVNEQKTDDNIAQLKEQLEDELVLVLKRCTMKGPAHEQLHHYLLPLKRKIDELEKTNYHTGIHELANYLDQYKYYFQ
jgi:hypothetical protein